jgi:hypothetical protein
MNWRSLIVLNFIWLLASSVVAVTIEGEFDTSDFYLFLNKFGFLKTEKASEQKSTFGYVFGNISAIGDFPGTVTLAVLDRHHFLEFYGNR